MLKIDLHTHSIASGHAINTIYEMGVAAKEKGILHLGITDHGPSMQGASHDGYFWVSDQINQYQGVQLYLGIEANIIDEQGNIDLESELLKKQKIISIGLHGRTPYDALKNPNHTQSIINAMENSMVQIVTHPYRPDFPTDLESIFYIAVKKNILLELNNTLFGYIGYKEELIANYIKLVKLCRKHDYPLIIGSDAHVASKIGMDNNIRDVQQKLNLPEELIINNEVEILVNWLKNKT